MTIAVETLGYEDLAWCYRRLSPEADVLFGDLARANATIERVVLEAQAQANDDDEMPDNLAIGCGCECCGCVERATVLDEGGEPVCAACGDYTVDDDGVTHCSREHDGETCPYCSEPIAWGDIQTHGAGAANDMDGECGCGRWYTNDRGEWTVPEYTRCARSRDIEKE